MRLRSTNSILASILIGLTAVGSPAAQGAGRMAMSSRPAVLDVALDADRSLRGVLSDSNGQPVVNEVIHAVRPGDQAALSTVTSPDGEFELTGLRGGLYTLNAAGNETVCRVWMADSAPPSAREQLLLVGDSPTIRGQVPRRPILFLIPIAAAVGYYIAVKEREDRPNGS